MMVDEADIDLVAGGSSQSSGRGIKRPAESPNPNPLRPSKRKAGPLPRDVCIRRPFSPTFSAALSTSPVPLSSTFGDLPTRPDSPLPIANLTTSNSTVDHIDIEEESDSLVIAVYSDLHSETALLNGTSKLNADDMQNEQHTVSSNSLQIIVDVEDNSDTNVTTTPIHNRLLNGDMKGNLSLKLILKVKTFVNLHRWMC